jgi:hypothetical protein
VLEGDEVVDGGAKAQSAFMGPSGPDTVDRDTEFEGREHVKDASRGGYPCVVDLSRVEQWSEIARWRQIGVQQVPADDLGMCPFEGHGELIGIPGDAAAPEVGALEGLNV